MIRMINLWSNQYGCIQTAPLTRQRQKSIQRLDDRHLEALKLSAPRQHYHLSCFACPNRIIPAQQARILPQCHRSSHRHSLENNQQMYRAQLPLQLLSSEMHAAIWSKAKGQATRSQVMGDAWPQGSRLFWYGTDSWLRAPLVSPTRSLSRRSSLPTVARPLGCWKRGP